ncbi:hypothetical protein E2C01_052845 [Portunus trituberculatus]|uniref:Uncharacterized protein n=1 Tax=Portunus trituberculatus TaxID=210409 RepID=A0A5B7GMY1_PORTR|nr:hypothetical protein [Portunus trituberculatus]
MRAQSIIYKNDYSPHAATALARLRITGPSRDNCKKQLMIPSTTSNPGHSITHTTTTNTDTPMNFGFLGFTLL